MANPLSPRSAVQQHPTALDRNALGLGPATLEILRKGTGTNTDGGQTAGGAATQGQAEHAVRAARAAAAAARYDQKLHGRAQEEFRL